MQAALTPALKNLSLQSAETVAAGVEKQNQARLQVYEKQRRDDAAKIDRLTSLVEGLSDTVSSMAAAQSGFQNEVLRLNRTVASQGGPASGPAKAGPQTTSAPAAPAPVSAPAPVPVPVSAPSAPAVRSASKGVKDPELAEIAQMMQEGKYEEGSVKVCLSRSATRAHANIPRSGSNPTNKPICSTTCLSA